MGSRFCLRFSMQYAKGGITVPVSFVSALAAKIKAIAFYAVSAYSKNI